MSSSWILRGLRPLRMTVLIAVPLLYFSIFPLAILIFKSFSPKHVETVLSVFSKKTNWIAFGNTLYLCFSVMGLSTLLGLPLAWFLYKTPIPRKSLWKSLFAVPYILPPYIGAIAWIKLANTFSFTMYSLWGTAWVLSLFFYSFIFLPCYAALEKIDPSLEEASLLCGASQWKTFKNITLPLLSPALLGGMILIFIATAASFGVPALLLIPVRTFVLTTKIYADVLSYSDGMIKASGLSLLLMVLGILGLWGSSLFLKNKRFTTITGKYTPQEPRLLKKWRGLVLISLSMAFGVMVFLPLVTIVITSFSNLSFEKYRYVLSLPLTSQAFFNSFLFASLASCIAVFLGTWLAYMKVKTSLKGKHLLDISATLPYATPGTVAALGFILAFSGNFGLNLYNTMWILIAAYTVKYLSFAIRNTAASLEQIDYSLEESARMSGASWMKTFFTIVMPLLKPALIASWFLIFMPTFSELTMSVFLIGPKTETIGTLLFSLQSYDDPQSAAVLATLIVFVILTANFSVKKLTKGQYGV